MIKIVTKDEMRAIEVSADAAGVSYVEMMENAGKAVAEVVKGCLGDESSGKRIAVLVGKGNNGGDGLVAARVLKQDTMAEVGCYLVAPRPDDDQNYVAARDAGVFIASADSDQRWRVLRNLIGNADVVIDALLGTGARLPITGDLKKLLSEARTALQRTRPARIPTTSLNWVASALPTAERATRVVAVDCPSGLDCDTGALDPQTIWADITVTLAAAKHGQLRFPGADAVGELVVSRIGIPDDLEEMQRIVPELATAQLIGELLPTRPRDSHKGSFGRAMIVAGSVNYCGAPVLAASAAYRAGAGLVKLAVPQAIYSAAVPQIAEAIWVLLPHEMGVINSAAIEIVVNETAAIDCMLIGPGLGTEDETESFVRGLFAANHQSRKGRIGFGSSRDEKPATDSGGLSLPMVVDADGLNLLSRIDGWPSLLPAGTILTPHVGEMSRLSGLSADIIEKDRIAIAQDKATAWKCVLVLKGAHTVVASPDGRVVVIPFATDALATAGTGDVLAGCILGMLAQGAAPFEAAVISAYLHGLAGTLAADKCGSRSVIASDVVRELADAIKSVERRELSE